MRLAALLLAFAWGAALAQPQQATEVQVKAAYLYQFGGFVEWPPRAFPSADTPFSIGVLGADQLAGELEAIVATRTVQGRKVQVRRLVPGDALAGLHVLFVGAGEVARLPELLAPAGDAALLVVTDVPDGPPPGSTINFVAVDNRVRFDIALAPARRSELRISSRLLGVARRVLRG